jgi:hypothetical protein
MLWQQYVFGRGDEVHELWDGLYANKSVRLLYIAGRGFDLRAQTVMRSFVDDCKSAATRIECANLLMVDFAGYELSPELQAMTEDNAIELTRLFHLWGRVRY